MDQDSVWDVFLEKLRSDLQELMEVSDIYHNTLNILYNQVALGQDFVD